MASTAAERSKEAAPCPLDDAAAGPALSLAAVFALAMGAALVTWAAFPPLEWWPLAAVGPIGWLAVVQAKQLPRWSWLVLWAAGCLYWLLLFEGIGRAHISARFGWFVLAGYLSLYLLLFVLLTRVALHTLRLPLILAAPVVWTGIELLRGLGPLGLSASLLGHAWVGWLPAIQIADLTGAYGVSFLVMFAAAGVASLYDWEARTFRWWPALAVAGVFGAALGYGVWRLGDPPAAATSGGRAPLRVALIQGSMDTSFEWDPGRDYDTFAQYEGLTRRALAEHPEVDVVLWPETVFTARAVRQQSTVPGQPDLVRPGSPLLSSTNDAQPGPNDQMTAEELRELLRANAAEVRRWMQVHVSDMTGANAPQLASPPPVQMLVGMGAIHFDAAGMHRYNSALHLDSSGKLLGRYDKMQPIAFGEYIPLGDHMPWLYSLTPMSGGLTPGNGPRVFEVRGWKLAPSICFESTIPHLIRGQVAELAARGEEPDLLVNITNDGWFWGSPILDHHLACGVFRAVENRKPLVIAANTGFSAIIDECGRIEHQGPRRATAVVAGEVRPAVRRSIYAIVGDWPAGVCLFACVAIGIAGLWRLWRPADSSTPALP